MPYIVRRAWRRLGGPTFAAAGARAGHGSAAEEDLSKDLRPFDAAACRHPAQAAARTVSSAGRAYVYM